MENTTWEEVLASTPAKLKVMHEMQAPNEVIDIYLGPVFLKFKGSVFNYDQVKIVLKWKPNLQYLCEIIPNDKDEWQYNLNSQEFEVGVNLEVMHKARVYSIIDGVHFFSIARLEIGVKPIKYQYVSFDLPNFNSLSGEPVKSNRKLSRERFSIKTEKVAITIDLVDNVSEIMTTLRYQEGILINARCNIYFKRRASFEIMTSECHCFNYFISFIVGRWTSMFCIEVDDAYKLYYSPYIQSFQYHSEKFYSSFNQDGLNLAYSSFSKMWKSKKDLPFIKKVIEWYTQVSITQVQHEASIILGQAVLELMYNHLIKNENLYLVGRDAESIATENKIRLLLTYFRINTKLPEKYKGLASRIFKNDEFFDGPMLVSKVRNAFVHGNLESEYFKLDRDEIYMVYDQVTAYIELVMIRLLDIKLELHWRLKEFETGIEVD